MKSLIHHSGHESGSKEFSHLEMHYNTGIELVYIRRGKTLWKVEDQVYRVEPESLFYTLPWEWHGGAETRQPGLDIFWVDIDSGSRKNQLSRHPHLPLSAAAWNRIGRILKQSATRCVACNSDTAQTFIRLVNLLPGTSAHEKEQARLLTASLLLDACALFEHPREAGRKVLDAASVRVLRVLEEIKLNPEKPFSLEDLAGKAKLKRSRFSDRVKHLTGDTPVQYVNRMRIERACEELKNSSLSVTEIAHKVGFSSSQYLARCFKPILRCTPAEFREKEKGQHP